MRYDIGMKLSTKNHAGFTLMELLVVIAIIGVFMLIVTSSFASSRSSGRDSQVRADRQTIKLGLSRTAEFTNGGKFPGTANQWTCLKTTSGTCFRGTGTVDAALNTLVLANMPGRVYPLPPKSTSGEYRYDSYVYSPSYVSALSSSPLAGYTGPILIWWQEKAIASGLCNGWNAGALDTGVYYCYEKVQ